MRQACIELNKTLKNAALLAGALGGGKCLHLISLSNDNLTYDPTPAEWEAALNECIARAAELNYEVSRVRGRSLTTPNKRKCRVTDCEKPATHHRPGLGEDWYHCEQHDQSETGGVSSLNAQAQ